MPTIADPFPSWDLYRKRAGDPVRLVQAVAPATEVWTSSDPEVAQALKWDSGVGDAAYINLVLKASRRYFESLTGMALITQTWKAIYDRVPGGANGCYTNEVELPKAPLIALTIVSYLDTNGAPQTATLSDYASGNVGNDRAYGRVRLKDTASWPNIGSDPGALSFTFTCGYGAAATSVPEEAKTALLMLAAHWYQNRLPVSSVRGGAMALPLHLQSLIELCRVADLA